LLDEYHSLKACIPLWKLDMIFELLELPLKTLFPLVFLPASPFLHAESLLFASLGTDSNEDHCALTAYCTGSPNRDNLVDVDSSSKVLSKVLARQALKKKNQGTGTI
jgi:hypothetical protein